MRAEIENHWPRIQAGKNPSYAELKQKAEAYLSGYNIVPRTFGHVGIIVRNIHNTVRWLTENIDSAWSESEVVWGSAFGCYITHRVEAGTEYEIIQPVAACFLLDFLGREGEGLHHLAFMVDDIHACLAKLKKAGVETVDNQIYKGVHGMVAFVKPEALIPLCLELYEPLKAGS